MFDRQFFKGYSYIVGCDEVGRGPIAGPVNGCALKVSTKDTELFTTLEGLGVTDSKKLTSKKRLVILESLGIDVSSLNCFESYSLKLDDGELSFCIWEHGPKEIDEMNILQASLSCMKNATLKLGAIQSKVLIDGNKVFDEVDDAEAVVKGDSKSIVIGLASIIAKEYRDRLMIDFDQVYPGYGLARHAGYPTKAHKEAVARLGVTPIHRKSFKGVKEYVIQGRQ